MHERPRSELGIIDARPADAGTEPVPERGLGLSSRSNGERLAPLDGRPSGERGLTEDIRVRLEGGPRAAAAARSVLGRLEGSVPPHVFDDLRLLVTELVTNSVRHAEATMVGLQVSLSRDTVRIEVTDHGRGFAPRPRRQGQDERSGWGLYLVDRLADRWGVAARDAGTSVWLELDRAPVERH